MISHVTNLANAEIEKSTGETRVTGIRAEDTAQATPLTAGAEATRVTAIPPTLSGE